MIRPPRDRESECAQDGGCMLSVYVPHGTTLERIVGRAWLATTGKCGLDRPRHADPARRQAGRADARHRRADPRGDAGDRGHQPPLCRERRALHDGDVDVPVGHRHAEDHARSPSSCPATVWSRCATTSRGRSRSSSTSSRAPARRQSPARCVLMDLLDAVIDRAADILERIGAEVDQVSHDDFRAGGRGRRRRHTTTCSRRIGRKGDLTSKVRESLVSIGRLLLVPRQRGRQHEAGRRTRGAQLQSHAARRAARCPTTPPISPTRSRSCSTPCSAWSPSSRTTSSRSSRSRPWC